jgi:hypothetical protein
MDIIIGPFIMHGEIWPQASSCSFGIQAKTDYGCPGGPRQGNALAPLLNYIKTKYNNIISLNHINNVILRNN